MEKYRNLGGNSGVSYFEIGSDFIIVIFKGNPKKYKYSYFGGAGKYHVENMKGLAVSGKGLNAYIKNHVNNLYDK